MKIQAGDQVRTYRPRHPLSVHRSDAVSAGCQRNGRSETDPMIISMQTQGTGAPQRIPRDTSRAAVDCRFVDSRRWSRICHSNRIESNRIESTIERAKFSERSQRGRRPALGKRCRILFPLGNAAVQIGAPTIALVTYGSIP